MKLQFKHIVASFAIALSASAAAVHVSPNGIGQALIYPYYTTRAGLATYIQVSNHTARAKALKVRFIEGKASKETLDFNLYLSPFDVWGVAVLPDSARGGSMIRVNDKSCTTPPIPAAGQHMFEYAYERDPIGNDPSRQREGYVEIIEMADLVPSGAFEAAVTHVNGLPADCSLLRKDALKSELRIGSGGISGGAYIINPSDGSSYSYNATALDNFSKHHPIWFEPGSIDPNLTHVNPKLSKVVDSSLGTVITDWSKSARANPIDPVSAAIMHRSLWNALNTDVSIGAQTAWVITLPTKSYYFRGNDAVKLFDQPLTADGSCVSAVASVWDSEEKVMSSDALDRRASCWETFVLNAGVSNPLVSQLSTSIQNAPAVGHMRVTFSDSYALRTEGAPSTIMSPDGTVSTRTDLIYVGLPAIGFAVQRYGDFRTPYPSLYLHRFETDIR
jgi:hypothetical protein